MPNDLKNPFKQCRAERRYRLMGKTTFPASFLGILVLCSSAGIARIAALDGTLPVVRGSTDPSVSQANIDTTICVPGYSRLVRPPYSLTGSIKRRLMKAEHPGERYSEYELDHLVPLSLGGAPADDGNLWLEPWTGSKNAGDKDALEYVVRIR